MVAGIPELYVWLAVLIICIIAEAVTTQLVSLWFSFGALGALIAAELGFGISVQSTVFVLLALLLLLALRPITRRILQPKQEHTNADRIVGQTAVVIETIDNQADTGQIRLLSQVWTARSMNNTVIPEGETVVVENISGVKAMVSCTQNEAGGVAV